MRQIFSALVVLSLVASSCTKDALTNGSVNATSADASHGSDDNGGNGTSGSGGGTRISAASVPAAVMNAYKAKFPGAARAEWKKLSNGNFKVQFFRNGVKWEATYTPGGSLVKLERD